MRARATSARRGMKLKRAIARHRLAVQAGAAGLVFATLFGAVKLGLPSALVSAGESAKSWAGRAAGLTIRDVTLGGLRNLKPKEVRTALALPSKTPLYDVDVAEARARLLQVAWIEDAAVYRVPPHRLHIQVKERVPAILWRDGKKSYAVEANGRVIDRVDPYEFEHLFQVEGRGAPEAAPDLMEALADVPIVERHVEYCEFVSGRRWDLHFDNHLVIELPDRGLPQALEILSRMITEENLLEHDILAVDLRNPGTPRLRLKKEVAPPQRGRDT